MQTHSWLIKNYGNFKEKKKICKSGLGFESRLHVRKVLVPYNVRRPKTVPLMSERNVFF